MEHPALPTQRARQLFSGRAWQLTFVLLLILVAPSSAVAQERLLFPAVDDAQAVILEKIRNEHVRLDIAVWYLVDREISTAIVNKHKSGVPVRVLGDRAALFEADPNTRTEFEYLALNGVPIRLRYHPTWFPELMHWKCGIFVGQNLVEFGSANWTTFELKPWTSTNFKDETVMFSDDAAIVRAFLTMFDRMWVDMTHFVDWHPAYKAETGQDWPTPMSISRARLEPEYPTNIPGMVWSQGAELNSAMVAEIDRELSHIDMVIYRLSDPRITDALIRRRQAGVPVRVFIEQLQYREPSWPEYWITGAQIDRLWLAGVQIKQRRHEGLTHMKTLITSSVALNGSANFTMNWQRDHNYFISAASKPALYTAMRDRFEAMWQDGTHYADFSPQRPEEPAMAGPAEGAMGVSTAPRLEWHRTRWAVAFDVYLGTSPQALLHQGRVHAHVVEDPPPTYSWTPGGPLQPNTTYYWHVVSRTYATVADPTLSVRSVLRSFTTGSTTAGSWSSGGTATGIGCTTAPPASGWICINGGWAPPDTPPPPVIPGGSNSGAQSSCVTGSPGVGWTCVNGGWLPPGSAPPPPPAPAPPPASSGCATPQPVAGWVCSNGGWFPPEMVPAAPGAPGTSVPTPPPAPAAPAAPAASGCATAAPGSGWTCVNGGWLPPGHPGAVSQPASPPPPSSPPPVPASPLPAPSTGCATPQPVAGWICSNGGWFPPEMLPAAPGSTAPGAPTPAPAAPPPVPIPSSCATQAPGLGWVCVNGGWLPPGHPAASCGGTADPFAALGGGTCVNGSWVPPAPAAPPPPAVTSSCATPDPFVAMGGGVCANGGWTPRN